MPAFAYHGFPTRAGAARTGWKPVVRGTRLPRYAKIIRLIVLSLLVAAIITAAILLFTTDTGKQILDDPRKAGADVREWVAHHRLAAPVAYIALYVLLVLLMLPVWWLQILSGIGFG